MWDAIQSFFHLQPSGDGSVWDAVMATLSIRLSDYGFASDLPICDFLISIWLGLCIAAVAVNVIRGQRRAVILALLRHKAWSEDDAKTISELRLPNRFLLRFCLRHRGGEFSQTVRVAGERQPTYEEYVAAMRAGGSEKREMNRKPDPAAARFYLAEGYLDRAKRAVEQKAPTVIGCVLSLLAITLFFALLIALMPEILSLLAGLK